METIYQNDTIHIVFDEALVTAEMFCVANTAFNYYVDISQYGKEDISVTERVRSGEVIWIFECCAALFRFEDGTGVRPYDVLSHSEMKKQLMALPHTFVKVLRAKVEFFFQLPENSLSKPILPSKARNNAGMVQALAMKMLENHQALQMNSSA